MLVELFNFETFVDIKRLMGTPGSGMVKTLKNQIELTYWRANGARTILHQKMPILAPGDISEVQPRAIKSKLGKSKYNTSRNSSQYAKNSNKARTS